MKHFDKADQIIIIAFAIVSIFVLWLISPMGKMYLPLSTEQLEESLNFKIPENYVLKREYPMFKDQIYNLYNDSYSPTVLSLIVMDNTFLIPEDIYPDKSKFATIKNFWIETALKKPEFNKCETITLANNPVYTCHVKAEKTELTYNYFKEGQVAIFKKGPKSIFLLSTASKMAYNPEITYKLIEAIFKDKNI